MTKASQKEIANRIAAGLNEFVEAISRGQNITRKFRCHKIILDLHPVPYDFKAVKATRKLLRASQAVFAQFLGVKTSTVQAWEQGRSPVNAMACRFMDEIQRNPDYFRDILRRSIRVTSQ